MSDDPKLAETLAVIRSDHEEAPLETVAPSELNLESAKRIVEMDQARIVLRDQMHSFALEDLSVSFNEVSPDFLCGSGHEPALEPWKAVVQVGRGHVGLVSIHQIQE